MGLKSSLIVSNKHILLVFKGLVIILKIASISAANEESQIYTVHLGQKKHDDPNLVTESHHDILGPLLGSKEASRKSMIYSYRHSFSGFAAKLTPSQAKELSEHPHVVHITRSNYMKMMTTRLGEYLGLNPTAPTGLFHETNMGSEVIVGILDSGIWPESESFNDNGIGPIPARWKGQCVTGDGFNASNCNRKLIGAAYYAKGLELYQNGKFNLEENYEVMSPRDQNGHGTHCASTAVGSFVQNANYMGLAKGTVRGSAPRARVAAYKVCWGNEPCYTGDIIKAIDHALRDGVDVLSLSIGSSPPLDFEVEKGDVVIAAFHAVIKGIPVVMSGGNDGPGAQTISNVAPWMITVAATTMDREYFTPITLGNNITILGNEGLYTAKKEVGFTDLLCFKDMTQEDIKAGKAKGKILLLFKTNKTEDDDGLAAFAQDNEAAGAIIVMQPTDIVNAHYVRIPFAYVDYELGMDILLYIRTTKAPTAKIGRTKTFVGRPSATRVARFSSRGPNSLSPAILKPDIAAPGSGILAAIDLGYQFMSGTSMATPAVAGIVALLKQKHPDWSPAAIRSALVTTALQTDPSGEPITAEGSSRKIADPFDYGGGLVNPMKAADPGLVYDMGYDEYVHYLCSAGYDNKAISSLLGKNYTCPSPPPSMLDVNLPSITIPYLSEEITITRTVTNVGPVGSVYKVVIEPPQGINLEVSPETLEFGSNTNKTTFKVKVSTTHRANTDYLFGSLTWTDNAAHNVRIPLSVRTRILNFKI